MGNYIAAERMKHKRVPYKKMLVLMPFVCCALAFVLMGPLNVGIGGYNWWYMMLMPFTLSWVAASVVNREKKYNFHGLFGVVREKQKIWYGKVAVGSLYLTAMCVAFFIFMLVLGWFCGNQIKPLENLAATLLLAISFGWQVPFFMYVALKTNSFVAVTCGVVLNFGFAAFCAENTLWWIPFAIPARLMRLAIGVRPNGLRLENWQFMSEPVELAIGVGISVCLYVVIARFTGQSFRKQEAV